MALSAPATPAAYALNDRQVDVETPEHVAIGYELADLGSRFTAMLIDVCIILALLLMLWFGLGLLAAGLGMGAGWKMGGTVTVAVIGLLTFALTWGYFVFFEGFHDGQTWGKKRMRIRVVQDGGWPLSFRSAAVRNLLRLIDIQPAPSWGLGALCMMVHPLTKRLGDMAAGTVVVRDRAGDPIPEEAPPATQASLGPPLLKDDEFAALAMYTQRSSALEPLVRSQIGGTLVRRLEPRLGDDPRRRAMPFDQYLAVLHGEEAARRRASGAGGRAGSGQATALLRRQKGMWDEYAGMLEQARRRGLEKLGEAQVSRFAALYREVAADLARARSYGGSPELVYALERTVGAGHNLLYRPTARDAWRDFKRWITGGFPALVRLRWRPIAVATAAFYVPALIGFAVVRHDPSRAREMLPAEMMSRVENARAKESRGEGYVDTSETEMPLMASGIMTNNIQVTFLAFAGGILAGLGTVLVLVFNGVFLGAVAAAFANVGSSLHLWTFVGPHGGIELTAICIAGGAGLWLGSGMILPGPVTRREALVTRGREAVSLIGGTAVLLVIAGSIEGFISPSALPREVKLGLAVLFVAMLVAYLLLAGRDEESRAAAEGAAAR